MQLEIKSSTPLGIKATTPLAIKEPPKKDYQWETKGFVTQLKTDRPVKSEYERKDRFVFGGVPEIFEGLRNKMTDSIASGPLPESVKPYAAMGGSFALEPLRFLAESVAEPEGIVSGIANKFLRVPTVAPKPVSTPTDIKPTAVMPPVKVYPDVQPKMVAEDTLLARALRNSDNPEQLLYPRQPTNGFAGYIARDKEIANTVKAQNAVPKDSYLEIPDKPLPIQPGDIRGGFAPPNLGPGEVPKTPVGSDGSLYTTVPQSLWPRRVQTSTTATIPDSVLYGPKSIVPDEVPQVTTLPLRGEATITSTKGTPLAEGGRVRGNTNLGSLKESASAKGIDYKLAETIEESGDDVVKKVLYDYVKDGKNGPLSSDDTKLKGMGSSGVELFRRSARFVHESRFNTNEWTHKLAESAKTLSKDEFDNFGNYVEGTMPIPNDKVKAVVDEWRRVAALSGEEASKVGMTMADGSPFKALGDNYWHRKLSKEQLDELPTRLEKLVNESGITRAEAEKIIRNAKEFGELILPSQRARKLLEPHSGSEKFPYRVDFEAGLEHLKNMARSTARVKNFGIKDTMGKGSDGVDDLIQATSDPTEASRIVARLLGRGEVNQPSEKLNNYLNTARTAVSWTRLQNFGLSSIIGNQLPNMMATDMKTFAGSLRRVIMRDKELGRVADESAALVNFTHEFFENAKTWTPMRLYGGEFSEKFVRSQAAWIGRANAKNYFQALKANPNNLKAKSALFDLVLEDSDDIMKQAELTASQLKMAAARQADISQGLTNSLNLPSFMTKPVTGEGDLALQLMLIFKKQATLQTKMMARAFKKNPVKTTALLAGFSQVAGGIIGTTKSAIAGTAQATLEGKDISQTIAKRIDKRSDYLKRYGIDNKEVRKAIDRSLQSWALGIGSDMAFWALDKNAFMEGVMGPVWGAASDIGGNITKPKQLGKEAAKMLPIPGGLGTVLSEQID